MPRMGREASRMNQKRHDDALRIVSQFLELAVEEGLAPRITNWATCGSVYLKFDNPKMGSMRIADHRGKRDREDVSKERYKYKWNLRRDVDKEYVARDRDTTRFFFGWHEIPAMVLRLKTYLTTINEGQERRRQQLELFGDPPTGKGVSDGRSGEERQGYNQSGQEEGRQPVGGDAEDRNEVGDLVRHSDSDRPVETGRGSEEGTPGEQEGSAALSPGASVSD